MDKQAEKKRELFAKRKIRTRKKVRGNGVRPRLCVFKSNEHLYAQLIDDELGKTIVGISTLAKALKEAKLAHKSREAAAFLGKALAKSALSQSIERVVFDRGPYPYHGLIEALAEAARTAGLKF